MTTGNKAVTGASNTLRKERAIRYDYERQCWLRNGIVEACGHKTKEIGCYACAHVGETLTARIGKRAIKPTKTTDAEFSATLKPRHVEVEFEMLGFKTESTGSACG